MTNLLGILVDFIKDPKAVVASLGLSIGLIVAIVSIRGDEKRAKRITLMLCACLGFTFGIVAVWMQHRGAKQDEKRRVAAENISQAIKSSAEAAAITLGDLAKLNEISPNTRYRVRLSVDPRPNEPCSIAKKIDGLFPGAISTKSVRVVYRAAYKHQPYVLLFGRDLSLASADVYQRLAAAHQLSNGLPPIEYERQEQEVDCASLK